VSWPAAVVEPEWQAAVTYLPLDGAEQVEVRVLAPTVDDEPLTQAAVT
jgi:hypothetical protein